jgi:DNA polymerase
MSGVRSDEMLLQELAGDLAAWLRRQSELGLTTLARREAPRQAAPRPSAPSDRQQGAPPQSQPAQSQPAQSQPPLAAATSRSPALPVAAAASSATSNEAIGRRMEEVAQSVSQTLSSNRPREAAPQRATTQAALRAQLGDCQRCPLCDDRTQLVFGEGAERPRIMFVGDMPTAEEDRTGRPLAGAEGELLTKMLQAMKLTPEQVYLTSVVKCRSNPARRPHPEEVRRCRPVLAAQIRIAEPEVIVVLGGAALAALKPDETLTAEDRGKWMELHGVPMMPTFHPTLLLQKPELKKAAWQDLQQVMKRLALS